MANASENSCWTQGISLARKLNCKTIVDVGANVGDTIAVFLHAFPGARAFALEPDPAAFPILAERYRLHKSVRVHQLALGEATAPGVLHQGANSVVSSLFPRNRSGHRYFHPGLTMIDQVPIAIQTLDNFCIDEKIRHINVLKLDTQGGEYGIIQGAQKLLSREAIDVIMTEFFFIPHYEDAPLLNQIWTALLLHGYHLFDLFQGPHGADGQARYGDAIFVSPNFRSRFLGAAHRLSGRGEASWTNLFRRFKCAIVNS